MSVSFDLMSVERREPPADLSDPALCLISPSGGTALVPETLTVSPRHQPTAAFVLRLRVQVFALPECLQERPATRARQ